ncbi:hypothetical protein ACQ4PT_044366 [Festuca glaucescens]
MTMGTRRCLALSYYLAAALLFLLTVFLNAPLTAAQPLPWQLCDTAAGNYTEGSAYQANIRVLASGFPQNASASPALFAKGAAGTAPDVVYALALCRGDTNASSCAACVAAAFQNAQQLCAFNRHATMFDNPCILRYSDQDFLANVTDNRGTFFAWNPNNVSAGTAAEFDAASGRLVNATADYAVKDPTRRYGTGEEGFDETYPKIYSLAQCTPDMRAADCRTCLRDIIGRFTPQYFVGKPGGRVFGVRCSFRFETFSFFSGHPLLQLPGVFPPAPAPAPAATGEGRIRHRTGLVLAITLPIAGALLLLVATCVCFWRRRKQAERKPSVPYSANQDDIQSTDSLLLDLSTLRAATDNFSESNKLGEGGFGSVYKGILCEGQEIAVKRLSQTSTQGIEELKTELVLVAKLQHKNLVRLVGVCLQGQEKLLVYEYMPNRSLDTVLFDSEKNRDLDWGKRLKIVNGVARGLQYLHQDSRLRIVHRDLKASNVLLDSDYNPKISDFGLAKLFGWNQSQAVTNHIAGTYGYMAPEYAMRGQYSVKSDAFSFGVLVLEIVTGRKNSSFFDSERSISLLSLVWQHWSTGTVEDLADPSRSPGAQMLKLVNIGLLCVQDNPADRPTMSAVNVMLSSSTVSLQAPSRPTFCVDDMEGFPYMYSEAYPERGSQMSPNQVSLTELEPR